MEIRVEKVGNRIWLQAPWRPGLPEMCKLINGASWRSGDKVWSYPLDWDTCVQLRETFGADLRIGPELTAWAREAKAQRATLTQLKATPGADLRNTPPALVEAMADRPYQQTGAAFIAQSRSVLLGDQPGLGKTLQTLAAVTEAQLTGSILVLAPLIAAQITWPRELAKWLPGERVFLVTGNRKQRQAVLDQFAAYSRDNPGERVWVICNTEMVRTGSKGKTSVAAHYSPTTKAWHAWPPLFEQVWSGIILDESHRAAICKSARVSDQSQARQGLGKLRLADGGLRVALSGTPMRGKRENLWGTLNWLRPELYTSFWKWVDKWFEVYDDGFSRVIADLKPNSYDRFVESLEPVMLRRTKTEVASELPEKVYAGERLTEGGPIGIWLTMDGKQAKAYQQMNKDAAALLEGGSLIANGVLSEMTRLKQFATSSGTLDANGNFRPSLPSNKFDWLMDFLEERDWGAGSKVVIASQFTTIINMLSEALGEVPHYVLTGETPARKREHAVSKFQSDDADAAGVFLLNTAAGGVSVTLDAADDLVFMDETWIPDDQEQVEDRIHRISRIHNVTIYYLRSLGTIEETIARETDSRENAQKQLLDGSRGVDFAKRLLKES